MIAWILFEFQIPFGFYCARHAVKILKLLIKIPGILKFRVTWDPPATCRWTRPEMDRASCGCTQVHGPSWTLAVLWRWHHPSLCREQQLMRWYSVTNFFHLLVVFIPGRSATRGRHWQLTAPRVWPFKLPHWHVRSRARQLMRLYLLPSLIGLSPWHGTGADSESAWPEAPAMVPSMQPRARSPTSRAASASASGARSCSTGSDSSPSQCMRNG